MTSPSPIPRNATPLDLLFPDLAAEISATRKMLEAIPDGHEDWKPHVKNMTLGALAAHVTEMPRFTKLFLDMDEMDWATFQWQETPLTSTAERLAHFDTVSAELTAALGAADWPSMSQTWIMRGGDVVYMKDLRATTVRLAGISHMVHHRAQLGVYLRLLDVAIPGPYGQSADKM